MVVVFSTINKALSRRYKPFGRIVAIIRAKYLRLSAVFALGAIIVATSFLVSRAQTAGAPLLDAQSEQELQELAILYPNEMNAELAKYKTADELVREE